MKGNTVTPTAVQILTEPTELLQDTTVNNSHDTAEKHSVTAFRTAFINVLPSWMSTQQEPENREHESGKLPKSND